MQLTGVGGTPFVVTTPVGGFQMNGNSLYFWTGSSSWYNVPLALNTWYHIVFMQNGTFCVNGVLNTGASPGTYGSAVSGALSIGGSGNTFVGNIALFKFYNSNIGGSAAVQNYNTLAYNNASALTPLLGNVQNNIAVLQTNPVVSGNLTVASNVIIGSAATATCPLHVQASNANGSIWASGDITAFSDARIKSNISEIEDAVSKVNMLRGVTFNRSDMPDNDRRYAGVIAQEVANVLPECVYVNTDGMMSVAYGNLVSILIQAIKELSGKICVLEGSV